MKFGRGGAVDPELYGCGTRYNQITTVSTTAQAYEMFLSMLDDEYSLLFCLALHLLFRHE